MKTLTISIYKFNELSAGAQEHAIEKMRTERTEYVWTEENKNTLEAFEKVFPIDITDWCYGGPRGVSFRFTVDDAVEELSGQRLATYIWNNYKRDLFKGKYYSSAMRTVPVDKDHPAGLEYTFRHSKIILENSCVLTGYCMDENILGPIYAFLNAPDSRTFRDLLEDCFAAWLKGCTEDMEYQDSDQFIRDEIEANEYEFTEDGERA